MNKYAALLIKLITGISIIAVVWWVVKCGSVNLKTLTPASIRDYIQQFGSLAALVYIAAYALNTISILPPIAVLSLAAGLAFGAFWGAVYLMAAAMLGTSLTFMISRCFARQLVYKILKGKLRDLDERIAKNGFMAVLFFRVVPLVPYEVLNYACGLTNMRFRDYFFATLAGLIPGVVIAAFLGGSLGRVRTFKDIFSPEFMILAILAIFIIAVPVVYKGIFRKDKGV